MTTLTDEEKATGQFAPAKATPADYAMYAKYSTFRLRLLAWLGDPVAKQLLKTRG